MNFIKHILSSLISAARGRAHWQYRLAVCVLSVATAASLAQLQPRRAQAQQTPITLHGAAALERLKQDGQYESLQAAMNQARFSVHHTTQTPLGRAAWHAPNPAAGYDAYVTEEGVSIAVKDAAYVSLSLHSLGYGAALQAVAPGVVSGDKQTINIEREGGLREWYVNGPDGAEQCFTLDEPPGARQAGAPLRLALQVSEGWRAAAGEDGKHVTLCGEGGQAVEYGKLVARDKLGRNILARLTVADDQIVIEVEDGEAAYPLTIDPLFTLQQRLLAADGAAGDYLGYSVALDGNTAVLGAPYDDQTRGSAYVFVRNGSTWTQQQKLIAQDGAMQDYFGWSVAIKGDMVLAGALYAPGSFGSDQGAAYVFTRSGTTWTQQARLNANENLQGAQFGHAVALDGDTALVGTPAYTITPSFAVAGAVFVFVRTGTTWAQQTRLIANDPADGDTFGQAVALEGDTAFVGSPNNAITYGGQGAAYVFTRSGATWTQRQRLTTTPAADQNFGNAVALSGDKALIGAYQYGSDDRGAVFTFRLGAAGWTQTDATFAPNPMAGAHFGASLALDGDLAVVGASLGLFQTGADQRSAYVFEVSSDPVLIRQFGPGLGAANDGFGYAVALSGDTVLVGAYRTDAPANDQGAGYTFVLHDGRHVEQQKLTANDGAANDLFGIAVALDGDTLAVGAHTDDVGTNQDQGSVYVFMRQGTVWTFQQKLTTNDGAANDYFGRAVALSGNTLVAGAYGDDIGGNADQGSAYVFTRSGAIWTQQQKLMAVAIDALPNDYLGSSVALSGNTLAVGAPGVNNAQGAVYVFVFNGTAWAQQDKLNANDATPGDQFGGAVALDGDTLGAGAVRDKIGLNVDQGSAYIFVRNGAAWTQQVKLTANDGAANDYFGDTLALSGDTVAVTAGGDDIGGNANQGSVYVFARTGTAWTQLQKLTANDGGAGDYFGSAIALSGDTLVIGASSDTIGTNSGQGSAYVFTRIGGWHQQQKLTASDGASNDHFGSAVALSGDTVAVGAHTDTISTNANQGSAYVFVSPPCPGITLAPASLPDGAIGEAYSQQLTGSGGNNLQEYTFAVSRGALPPGLALGPNTGILQGTPTVAGTYRFTVTARDSFSSCPGSREYTITIPPCPAITVSPAALPDGVKDMAYNQVVTAAGGTGQYTFAVTAGALPPGLSLGASGAVSGTPSQAGSYNFTVTATSNYCTGTRAYTLVILSTCPTLTVSPPTLPNGMVGVAYSQTLTVTGGAAPYVFPLSLGSTVPPGTFLNGATGVLSGTPTTAGTFSFEVRPRDANGCQGSKGYSVTIVANTCSTITINPASLPAGTVGAAYNQMLTAAGGVAPYSFTVSAGTLPTGLSLTGNGALTGTPNAAGTFNFTVRATDANGCQGTRSYAVTVNPAGGGNAGLQFYPLERPVRILDTRAGQGNCDNVSAPINAGSSLSVPGRLTCEGITIPMNAQAVVGNVTVINQTNQTGYMTVYPDGQNAPLAANMIYGPGGILANNFTVGLGANGNFTIFGEKTIDAIVDISGYYAPPAAGGLYYHPLSKPVRLLDTRPGFGNCDNVGTPIPAGTSITKQARITCESLTIPATAQAIVGNATVINGSGQVGYLTLYPNGVPAPLAANIVYFPGQILANAFTVSLSANGEFNIFGEKTIDMVIDVAGYYSNEAVDANGAGLLFTPLATPVRLLDTRAGFGNCDSVNAPIASGTSMTKLARMTCEGQLIPNNAQAVIGNVTVINQTAQAGYLTLYPTGQAAPLVANMIYQPSQILSNAFVVGLNGTGQFNLFAERTLDVIVDVSGFFAP